VGDGGAVVPGRSTGNGAQNNLTEIFVNNEHKIQYDKVTYNRVRATCIRLKKGKREPILDY